MTDRGARTTILRAIVDAQATLRSWYLLVTLPGEDGTQVVPLDDGAEVVVGRQEGCTIVVDSEAISRRHATIRRQGGAITVEDLGSRNGTTCNGSTIERTSRVSSGDVIGFGPASALVVTTTPSRGRQLATIGELENRLEGEVERALRYRRPLGIAMLRFEG